MAWDFVDACRDLTIMSYSDGASFSRDSSSCGMMSRVSDSDELCACLLEEVLCIVGIQNSYSNRKWSRYNLSAYTLASH